MKPGIHLQVYLLIPSMQVAPFRQGSKIEINSNVLEYVVVGDIMQQIFTKK